jgi:TFIIF-interacting CTD phosphatase-like protein
MYHAWIRESTTFMNGMYVKDLSKLNRDLAHVIIIDDNPDSFQLQPENGIHIKPFKDANDVEDTALLELIPLLEG